MASEAIVLSESDVPLERWSDPVRGEVGFRTLVGGGTPTDSLTAGVTEMRPGDLEHDIRNTGAKPLRFFYAFAVASFEDVDYHFSAAEE